MIDDSNQDLREILQSSERPRALTEAEERRMLVRLNASVESVADPRPFEVVEFQPHIERRRTGSRVGWLTGWVAGAAAAVSLLVVVVSVREPTQLEPVVPLVSVPMITPPEPADFCTDHVDAISTALERWRGLENWAFAGGAPDVGALADEALLAAAESDRAVPANRATDARDQLRATLDQIDASASGRDAIAPRVEAVDDALDTIAGISSDVTPPCDLTRFNAARNLG